MFCPNIGKYQNVVLSKYRQFPKREKFTQSSMSIMRSVEMMEKTLPNRQRLCNTFNGNFYIVLRHKGHDVQSNTNR